VRCPGERPQVRAWRLIKDGSPTLLAGAEGWVCRWMDAGVLREVHASSFVETWTQYDPELVEREYLPSVLRREPRAPPRKDQLK
jgi:hypothetical protein